MMNRRELFTSTAKAAAAAALGGADLAPKIATLAAATGGAALMPTAKAEASVSCIEFCRLIPIKSIRRTKGNAP
jgi:hypothetical protein